MRDKQKVNARRRSLLAALAFAPVVFSGEIHATAQQMLVGLGKVNAVWSAVSSFTTARGNTAGVGSRTSAAVIAGDTDTSETVQTASTQVLASGTWSAGANTTSARSQAGCSMAGTVAAAAYFGGRTAISTPIASTIQGDATTSWSAGGNLAGTTRQGGGGGTQSAAIQIGGFRDGVGSLSTVQIYSGATWSTTTSLSSANRAFGSCGTSSDCVIVGSASATQATFGFNGTAWAAGQNMITQRTSPGAAGAGANSLVVIGGYNGAVAVASCELFTTAFATTSSSLSAAKYTMGSAGIASGALCLGGFALPGPATTTVAEQFS